MKKTPAEQSHNVFHQARKAVGAAFEARKASTRLQRGASYFVKQHSETMKMLARESEHPS